MSDLTKAYEDYHGDPNPDTAKELLSEVKNYDFTTFEEDLKKLQELAEKETSLDQDVFRALDIPEKTELTFEMFAFNAAPMTTNGSTGNGPTAYAFGPNYQYWRSNLTDHLRNPENIEREINLENVNKGSIVNTIERTEGDVWLSGRPADFIFPTTDPKTSEYIKANADKIKYLTTYDTEPLIRSSIYHNDQMIDWTSGLNFRTCRHGNKHILPTFAFLPGNKVRNMLNLHRNKQEFTMSDLFKPKGFFQCPCGATACDLEFIPHFDKAIKNKNGEPFYLPSLMNDLHGSYMNLQFLQEEVGGKVLVYVVPNEVPASDYDHIRDLLADKGFDSELKMNRYFMVGRKLMHFWQSSRAGVKEFNSKMMI